MRGRILSTSINGFVYSFVIAIEDCRDGKKDLWLDIIDLNSKEEYDRFVKKRVLMMSGGHNNYTKHIQGLKDCFGDYFKDDFNYGNTVSYYYNPVILNYMDEKLSVNGAVVRKLQEEYRWIELLKNPIYDENLKIISSDGINKNLCFLYFTENTKLISDSLIKSWYHYLETEVDGKIIKLHVPFANHSYKYNNFSMELIDLKRALFTDVKDHQHSGSHDRTHFSKIIENQFCTKTGRKLSPYVMSNIKSSFYDYNLYEEAVNKGLLTNEELKNSWIHIK